MVGQFAQSLIFGIPAQGASVAAVAATAAPCKPAKLTEDELVAHLEKFAAAKGDVTAAAGFPWQLIWQNLPLLLDLLRRYLPQQ